MQSYLSLVLIPPFFFFSHCCGVEELGAAAVSADCSVESAEGDKPLDAITHSCWDGTKKLACSHIF